MLDTLLEHRVDVIQIGTRNMQNFDLLKEVGKVDVPVILKRGMSATISEWLMAAEYIAAGGKAWMVPALSCAAVAAGADALLIEVHPCPAEAWCDADQALSIDEFASLMTKLRAIASAVGRTMPATAARQDVALAG